MSDEVSRGRGNGKAAFSSQLPALRAEAAFVAPAFPRSLVPFVPRLDHETIVRQMPVIIGKLHRDQRSGVRDQKKNGLGSSERPEFGARGVDILNHRVGSQGFCDRCAGSFFRPLKRALGVTRV